MASAAAPNIEFLGYLEVGARNLLSFTCDSEIKRALQTDHLSLPVRLVHTFPLEIMGVLNSLLWTLLQHLKDSDLWLTVQHSDEGVQIFSIVPILKIGKQMLKGARARIQSRLALESGLLTSCLLNLTASDPRDRPGSPPPFFEDWMKLNSFNSAP